MKRTQYISASALFSGFTAKAYGGDFWEGARQGATTSALNHLSHSFSNDIITQIENRQNQNGGRPDLGFVGNQIRDRAGSEFSKDLFENYWQSGRNVNLSSNRFNNIVSSAGAVVSTSSVTFSNGQQGVAKVHNFYNSTQYSLALGRATIYYNQAGTAVGFFDRYNFDPKPWGVRSYTNEVKTRAVNTEGNAHGATPFNIYYGIRP